MFRLYTWNMRVFSAPFPVRFSSLRRRAGPAGVASAKLAAGFREHGGDHPDAFSRPPSIRSRLRWRRGAWGRDVGAAAVTAAQRLASTARLVASGLAGPGRRPCARRHPHVALSLGLGLAGSGCYRFCTVSSTVAWVARPITICGCRSAIRRSAATLRSWNRSSVSHLLAPR